MWNWYAYDPRIIIEYFKTNVRRSIENLGVAYQLIEVTNDSMQSWGKTLEFFIVFIFVPSFKNKIYFIIELFFCDRYGCIKCVYKVLYFFGHVDFMVYFYNTVVENFKNTSQLIQKLVNYLRVVDWKLFYNWLEPRKPYMNLLGYTYDLIGIF